MTVPWWKCTESGFPFTTSEKMRREVRQTTYILVFPVWWCVSHYCRNCCLSTWWVSFFCFFVNFIMPCTDEFWGDAIAMCILPLHRNILMSVCFRAFICTCSLQLSLVHIKVAIIYDSTTVNSVYLYSVSVCVHVRLTQQVIIISLLVCRNTSYSPEELIAMLFNNTRHIAEAHAGTART